MKNTTTVKKRPTTRTAKTKKTTKTAAKKPQKFQKLRRLHYLTFAGVGVLALVAGTLLFNHFKQSDAYAQAPLPIQTFTTSYSGYNTGTGWISSLTPAQRCTKTQTIYGAKPTTAGNYPTLIYVHGTTADLNKNKEGQRFVELAAAQGFVAMAVTYSSMGSMNEKGIQRHSYCMFDQSHPKDALTAACSAAGASCSNGVLLAGFSQGASIATIAKNYNQKVKAVWAIGLSAYIYPFGCKQV